MNEDVRQVIAEYDARHLQQCPVEKRRREIRDGEREQKAREAIRRREAEQRQASNTQWWTAIDQRIVEHIELFREVLYDALGEIIGTERADRRKEIRVAVEETKREIDAKLEALEQRIVRQIKQCFGRDDILGEAIAAERANREKEINAAAEEFQRVFDVKLETLEQRLKAMPGKLPVAKTWHPETVTYQAEFVSHEGALYQARKDTAQTPGGSDWVCVARAGHDGTDGLTPNVCGTYDAHKTYEQLDIVALDGAAFIAKRYDPGICPGDGWQMLSRQGKAGRKGETGDRGPKGDRGPPAIVPQLVSSEIDENYNLVMQRSDGSREIVPLRAAFERYHSEVGR